MMELQRRSEADQELEQAGQFQEATSEPIRNELALSQEEIEQAKGVSLFDDNKLNGGLNRLDPDRPNYRATGIPEQDQNAEQNNQKPSDRW